MTEGVVSVESDASLKRAIGGMIRNGIGSDPVAEDDRPVGILTETDVLRAMYLVKVARPDIAVEREMTAPPVSIAPDKPIEAALRTIEAESIKKLPVEEDLGVVGLLTLTDLAYQRPKIVENPDAIGDRDGG